MFKAFAIHNAPTDHGGIIPATQQRTSQMGNFFVRAGDGHFCPKCKCWSEVIKSHDHIIMDGRAVAYVDDVLTCGAKILPQQAHVVGDSQGSSYLNSNKSSFTNTVLATFDEQIVAVDENGNCLPDFAYYIKSDVQCYSGRTDEQGKTERIATNKSSELQIWFGDDAELMLNLELDND